MAYNMQIEERLERVLSDRDRSDHRKMFGGVCYLINGNMFCGVLDDFLILRLGEQKAGEALGRPHVRPFDITGRPMKGWVMVAEDGFQTDEKLAVWLEQAADFVRTLPAK